MEHFESGSQSASLSWKNHFFDPSAADRTSVSPQMPALLLVLKELHLQNPEDWRTVDTVPCLNALLCHSDTPMPGRNQEMLSGNRLRLSSGRDQQAGRQ